MNESEQMMLNELRRLERAIEKRQKALASLKDSKGSVVNHRYVIDLPIEVTQVRAFDNPEVISYYLVSDQPVSRSFVVDRDCTYFCCKELVYTPSLVGTITLANPFDPQNPRIVAGKFSLPNTFGYWFDWEVRDTYSDRSWQNLPLPDFSMASGKTIGLVDRKPAILPAGTEVIFTMQPLQAIVALASENERLTPTSYSLQVSFVGFEVLA